MNREFPWYNMEIVIVEANFLMHLNFILLMGKWNALKNNVVLEFVNVNLVGNP